MSETRKWRYLAENADGEVSDGVIAAAHLAAAAKRLRLQGLKPFDLKEVKTDSAPALSLGGSKNTLSSKEWTKFAGLLSDLLNAGVPAVAALQLIARQESSQKIGKLAKRMADRLRSGEQFSDALAEEDAGASRLMIALIATGEALGDLGGQFARLKKNFEARDALRQEIAGNLIYPGALFVLIVLTLLFLSFVVLPQFESVFSTSGAEPPAETKFVLAAGALIREWWSAFFAAVLLFAILLRFSMRRYRDRWDLAILNAPIVGAIILRVDASRYCRSLGALLDGGAPLAGAMPIAQEAVSSHEIRRRLLQVQHQVRSGGVLSAALREHNAVTQDALAFIELGEATGALGAMVLRAADHADQQLEVILKRFAAFSGPAMTAVMGLLTAGVIAAVMSGVLSLNDAVY